MNIRLLLSLIIFIIAATQLFGQQQVQSTKSPEELEYHKKLNRQWNSALGTFQIQIVNSRINPVVEVFIIEKIEEARKDNEVVYIPLMDKVRIMILPRNQISEPNFEKIEVYKYVSE